MSHTGVKEGIEKLKPGSKDAVGNKIHHVLAKGNEYCIYEIEHDDINYRLRVEIDGITDESEQRLVNKFNVVKNKYIIAKGLLYRSQNHGVMKNRVAHILSSCLQGEDLPQGGEFDELIDEIKTEIKRASSNRLYYFAPSIFLTLVFTILCIVFSDLRHSKQDHWHLLIVLLSSLLGSSISILSSINRINFDELTYNLFYSIIGFERIFLSCVSGAIAYILIRSKLIFPQIGLNDYWNVMIIIIVSAFSEKLIPNILGRVEKRIAIK